MKPAVMLAFADEGRIRFDSPGQAAGLLAKLQGERIRVTIDQPPTLRSLAQNRKLWATYSGALSEVKRKYKEALLGGEEHTGHTKDEVHEALKVLYCPEKPVVLPGGEEIMVRSTKLLTKEEFSAFMERAMAHLAGYGINLA